MKGLKNGLYHLGQIDVEVLILAVFLHGRHCQVLQMWAVLQKHDKVSSDEAIHVVLEDETMGARTGTLTWTNHLGCHRGFVFGTCS
jgi:hypothetical protein